MLSSLIPLDIILILQSERRKQDLRFTIPQSALPDHTRNIHERFLRHIWSRQYLEVSRLRTCDGRPLKVIEVGTLNFAGGPDFAEAKVKIGATTFVGDVEIHRTIGDWFSHHHQNDPRYNRVVLHVVLEGSPRQVDTPSLSGRKIPVLILSDFLSEPIQTIWQRAILDERARRSETIKCFNRNNVVPDVVLTSWLRKLATERLELKLRRFEERLKDLAYERLMTVRELPKTYGEPDVEGFPEEIPPPLRELSQQDLAKRELWEQILYEGLMEGLGYTKNQEPFLRLARSVTLKRLREFKLVQDEKKRETVLFAVAGLLPKIKSMRERDSKDYVRALIRAWNDLRSSIRIQKLRASDWQFFPTRPGNFPPLRISAANILIGRLLNEDLFRKIIQTLKYVDDPKGLRTALTRLLSVQSNRYWMHHYDFDQPTRKAMVALGVSRIDDILINTVVPVALLYARIFKEIQVRENTLRLYESFPSAGDNVLTRMMQNQLLHNKLPLNSASRQQGMIQLYKFYCSENRCGDCEVSKYVSQHD